MSVAAARHSGIGSAVCGFGSSLRIAMRTLRGRDVRRVLLAYLTFNVAEWATWVSLLVWAFDRGGIGASSTAALAQLLPAIAVAPVGSVLGDRLRRSRALALGYGLQALSMAATASALALAAPFAVVCTCAAVVTCAITLTRPVHNSLLPDVSRGPEELTAANAASSTVEGAAALLGPLLGALLLQVWGAGSVFAVFGAAVAVAALAVAWIPLQRDRSTARRAEGWLASLLGGGRELLNERGAALLVGIVAGQYVVVGLLDILTVVLAIDVLDIGTSGPGSLVSVIGAGSLLGAVATVVLVGRRRLAPALGLGLLATGVPLAATSLSTSLVVALPLLALTGAGKSFCDVTTRTLLQRTVRSDVLARIFGVQEALMTSGIALGALLAPLLVHAFGSGGALIAAGSLLPVIGALAWAALRRVDAAALQPGTGFALLLRVPMFRLLPLSQAESLSRDLRPVEHAAGTAIFRQGEAGNEFFLIEEGEVEVLRNDASVRILGPGDSFGEIALLRDVARTATVVARTDVSLQVLRREPFLTAVTGTTPSRAAADEVATGYLAADEDAAGR